MADQDRWTSERERGGYRQEERFRQGFDHDRRGGRQADEGYGDYGRSFEPDRGDDRAYAAGYGIDEDRYGGRWGRGPEDFGGEPHPPGRFGQPEPHRPDRTWMERAGERVASFFGGGEVERSHRGRGPRNYIRSDERIQEDVSERLADDPFVDASEIEVQVASGEVTLSGFVTRREERRRAEDLVEQVLGVRHVQNNIRVQPPTGNEPLPFPLA